MLRALAVATFAVLVLTLAAAAPARAQQAAAPQGISVVGEAESFADNDIGTFRFGVSVRRPTAAAALRSASAAVSRVVGSVRASGVAREDIQTDVVTIERVTSGRRSRRGWIARNAVRVTIRRLAEAGTVVDRAVGAGATSVDGPQLGVADIKEIYRRTLAAAFADARAKAERLAAQAGIRLGAPIRIRESGADAFDPGERAGDESAAGAPEQSQDVAAEIQGGRSSITASVAVTFSVAP